MVTRKSASKRPAAKAARPAAPSETKPAAAPKRAAKAAPAMPRTAAPTPAVAAPPAPSPATAAPATAAPTGEARYRWIAHAAYLRAERRGFAPGKEVDDWLAAEAEFRAVYGVR